MDIFKVSASALEANRIRMNTIASNMANAQSTDTEGGGPYVKKNVIFQTMPVGSEPGEKLEGVRVSKIVEDTKPPVVIYDPGHPDADENGYVSMPDINVIEEMVNMMMALRAYEANVKAFNISKGMFQKALELGRF
ncbi:MAG TPA: flagellar basal body rod protein FlgC [Nitrospirae bacterium]|nr:flagellar basal-body rod protein FlgC [bacterium BMS3Abin06]HDH10924.1 flagellar basal body rod protein FlgC [Nitrospirota bacterium]HDZ00418.1 flagellar basal body rod protein FlgC [Nitrospirota bacterium]